jgi:SAM-dependent methyltransferase
MNPKSYDGVIEKHYQKEALLHGLKPTCTMEDRAIRESETSAIAYFVNESLQIRKSMGSTAPTTIVDVGCGNGYTLQSLVSRFPDEQFVGFDKTPELLQLARSRFANARSVSVVEADIRSTGFSNGIQADVLICQRVLINILDADDQKEALRNLIQVLKRPVQGMPSGKAIFVESFTGPLEKLNTARAELDLPPLKPAYHNLYLDDSFFETPELGALEWSSDVLAANALSTHYFIARVIYPLLKSDKSISRNSELVNFFVGALNKNVGDYSPLKIY